MDLSSLTRGPQGRKKRKRVGRGPGSGKGKTCGRGSKGQKSRSGYSRKSGFEGGQMPLNRRLPKRGFNHRDRFPMAIVNIDALEKHFEDGAEIAPAALVEAGIASMAKGGLKILGRGELTKRLTVKCNAVSDSARNKIEAAGGAVELIEMPKRGANGPTSAAENPGEGR